MGGGQSSRTWLRCFSSEVQIQNVDKNIRIHSVDSGTVRPLVLMFSWLLAKGKHLQKYRDMYLNEGFDVETIQVHTNQLLLPRTTQSMMENVLDMLAADQSNRPLLVHGFSVGGYAFGELLLKLIQNPEKYATIKARFQGLIFDSPVDINGIPLGVSRAATQNRIYRKLIHSMLDLYLKLPNTKHYMRSSEVFKQNAFDIPSLLLYSLSDPVVEPEKIESIASQWREKGVIAHTKFWNEAQHVSLFMKYPDEYTNAVVSFIRQCGLGKTSEGTQKKAIFVEKRETQDDIHDDQKQKSRVG